MSSKIARMSSIAAVVVPPLLAVIAFFGAWQLAVRLNEVSALVLPAPSDIAFNVGDNLANYAADAWITLREALLGFALALLVSIAIAAAMIHSNVFRRAVNPLQTALRCTPVVAFAPAFALWLGFGAAPKVIVAALITFPPFLVNAVTGLRAVDPLMLEVLRSVNASRREIFFKLRVPHALPYLFSAAKVCTSLALIGAVVGEWSGSAEGLGYRIVRAQKDLETTTVWGAIFVLALMGIALTLFVTAIERYVSQRTFGHRKQENIT